MTTDKQTEREEKIKKIKAHFMEFPNDRSSHVAQVFEVPVSVVYDAKEFLRRHKMLPRVLKLRARKPAKKTPQKVEQLEPQDKRPTEFSYELALLRAENARLKAIIEYLEAAAGIKKAA